MSAVSKFFTAILIADYQSSVGDIRISIRLECCAVAIRVALNKFKEKHLTARRSH